MQLIASLTSPFARKIRVLLHEKAIPCDLVIDIPWNADTRVPQFNPLGKVPVLVTDAGQSIYDSAVIAEYIDSVLTEPQFLPADRLRAIEVKVNEALADGITDAAVTIFVERKRAPERQDGDWIDRQLGKINHGSAALERRLAEKSYLAGDQPTLADIAAACSLGYLDFRFPDIDWRTEHASIVPWAEQLFRRPSFVHTRPPA